MSSASFSDGAQGHPSASVLGPVTNVPPVSLVCWLKQKQYGNEHDHDEQDGENRSFFNF